MITLKQFFNVKGRDTEFDEAMATSTKEVFLSKLRSSGKLTYKRYGKSPIRYPGGKSAAVGIILEKLPADVKNVMSPFVGGGTVEIAIANELDIPVRAYDIFDVLVNYWQIQLKSPHEISRRLLDFTPNRTTFAEVKNELEVHWEQGKKHLDKYDLAAHYYFNHNMSYGPFFLGNPSDAQLSGTKYYRAISRVHNFKAPNLSVKKLSFEKSIPKHPNDFIYADPPYYLEEGTVSKGLYPSSTKPIFHDGFDHRKLRDLLLNHKGGFLLSYNDCPTLREWYKDCSIEAPEWKYGLGQGNRGDKKAKKSSELLIWRPASV